MYMKGLEVVMYMKGLEALEALLSTEVYQGLLRGPCSSVAPCPSVNSPLRHLGM